MLRLRKNAAPARTPSSKEAWTAAFIPGFPLAKPGYDCFNNAKKRQKMTPGVGRLGLDILNWRPDAFRIVERH